MKTIDILNGYIKFETKLFHLTWKKKGKSKTCHGKSQGKDKFEFLGMNP
jgi:hypothetical protein